MKCDTLPTQTALTFDLESYSDSLVNEIHPLLVRHYHEISRYQDIPLDPDWFFYRRCDQTGMLRIYTARDAGRLVGYAIFFVKENPHYSKSLQAVQDILFFAPEMRKGTAAIKFLKWVDVELAKCTVQVVYHHVKTYKNFGKVLERQGYEAVDVIYAKRLDKGRKQ